MASLGQEESTHIHTIHWPSHGRKILNQNLTERSPTQAMPSPPNHYQNPASIQVMHTINPPTLPLVHSSITLLLLNQVSHTFVNQPPPTCQSTTHQSTHPSTHPAISQPTPPSTHLLINQPTHSSINTPSRQPTHSSINPVINPPAHQSTHPLTHQSPPPTYQPTCSSINPPTHQSTNASIISFIHTQPSTHPLVIPSTHLSIYPLLNQCTNQPTHHSTHSYITPTLPPSPHPLTPHPTHSAINLPTHQFTRLSTGPLTHWGRVTQICVNKLTIIGSDNGLSPGRHQHIIWTKYWNTVNWNLKNKPVK